MKKKKFGQAQKLKITQELINNSEIYKELSDKYLKINLLVFI